MTKKPKYIFVVGGVMSGVGKGTTAASIGRLLQSRGFEVTAMKIDPYINVDAGTMNPTEHGEVFVLDDGLECDQDMGNYERFLERDLGRENYMTTGSIYQAVINKERNLEYNGKCVEVVPHIPLEVISRIKRATAINKADIIIIEIGGTVGEYQNILFLEAIRILKFQEPGSVLTMLVSYLPSQGDGELKTKPTQHAVRALNAAAIQPDIIIARASTPLDKKRKEKIAFNCNVPEQNVISAPNLKNIYELPLNFHAEKIDEIILKTLGLKARELNLNNWKNLVNRGNKAKTTVKIGVVGKYFATGNFILSDSYISVLEAIKHAGVANGVKTEIVWLNSEEFEDAKTKGAALKSLEEYNGIIVPGGFGSRGVEGKINVIEYCRKNKIPYFGLCYGMQLAAIEYARHVAGLTDANTTEVDSKTKYPIIDILPEQKTNIVNKNYGASMRLGKYPAMLRSGTIAHAAYGKDVISERHRHRYEVNPDYVSTLKDHGAVFSGTSKDSRLMEIMELPRNVHPFFLGTQFHPEFKSRPLTPHPLFTEFVKAAKNGKKEQK